MKIPFFFGAQGPPFSLGAPSVDSFLHFSQQLSLWSSVIVKVLGQNDMFVFLRSWQHMAFASQKVFWSVPQTVISIGLTVSCGYFGQTSEKVLCRVPPTILHICLPQMMLHSSSLRVPPTVLYIYLPVSSWGQSC